MQLQRPLQCLVNGVPQETGTGETRWLFDRGLHYGDGLFETIALRSRCLELWQYHFERLCLGCQTLQMPVADEQQLLAEMRRLLEGIESATVKLIITRGDSNRGYLPEPATIPRRILFAYPLTDNAGLTPVSVTCCNYRLPTQTALGQIKHCNRLDQVMARLEWAHTSAAEGLLADFSGNVISGTMSNVFIVSGDKLITPELTGTAGVSGTMRRAVLERAAQLALNVELTTLKVTDLLAADEMFLTNSLIRICPVKTLQNKSFAIPGATTKTLSEDLEQWLAGTSVSHWLDKD